MFEHNRGTFYVSDGISFSNLRFENDVEMYGAQAEQENGTYAHEFENDVEMYGAQAFSSFFLYCFPFENDVEMYGAQALIPSSWEAACLRMM